MASISNLLFGKKPIAPERVSTDEIIPLYERDDTAPNRAISLEFTMVFDEVLNADKLSGALWRLIDRPGWRKLGARLRLNDKGKLEYHVPREFTKKRPPMNYTHQDFSSVAMRQHPLGKTIPRANDKLEVFPQMSNFRIAKSPAKMEHWIYTDKAQLDLYITSFSDATFVTITWLHTLLDAMGRHALLSAWQLVLEGRENELPEFVGYKDDPLADLGKGREEQEESVLKPKLIGKFGMARFVGNMVVDSLWYPNEEVRMLVLPGPVFEKIKRQAYLDLNSLPADKITYTTSKTGEEARERKPFLSDGDILTAWFLRLTSLSHPSMNPPSGPSNRQIAVVNVMGMRTILQNTNPPLLPKDGVYIANCVTALWSHFPIHTFLTAPLGHVAAQIRSDLVSQGSRGQIEASQALAKGMGGILPGSGDMSFATMTNWDKARLFGVDFGAAIVGEKRGVSGAKPVYIHPIATENGFKLRGSANVVGKDVDGNYWLGAMLRSDVVDTFEKEIAKEAERLDSL